MTMDSALHTLAVRLRGALVLHCIGLVYMFVALAIVCAWTSAASCRA